MAIELDCIYCDKELQEPGAVLLSPPAFLDQLHVEKYHLCVLCWDKLVDEFFRGES